MSQQQQYKPTGETAIIIVPPLDICAYADYYRSRYMLDTMHTIEPHITVLVPFAPYDQLAAAEPLLKEALAECAPRRLSLRSFGAFRDEGVLFLQLADDERVLSLYHAIHARFPEYIPYGGKFGDDFHPHMTVGLFPDPAELDRVHRELSVQKLYIGFDVEQVVVKYKNDDGLWDTWGEYALGGSRQA